MKHTLFSSFYLAIIYVLSLYSICLAGEMTSQPTAGEVNAVKQYIHETWPKTIMPGGQEGLPKSFTVPSWTLFKAFYYWDTYFTSIGLVRDGQKEVACNNAENMMFLIEKMGYVPNGSRAELTRSQPPIAALQIRLCLEFVKDRDWLARAYAALEKEYGNWMATHAFPDGLNHYGNYATPLQMEQLLRSCRGRLAATIPDEPVARQKFAAHVIAVAESGWDFSPRWGDHCQNYGSVDLNSLLFALEGVEADLAKELANGRESLWRNRMEARRTLMNRLLWDDERGLFVDYDESTGQKSAFISAASYFPLFCGLASPLQAERTAKALAQLETPYGLDTCVPGKRLQKYQWDSPNLWPPLQWVAVSGLLQTGHREEARLLARKYVATVVRNFKRTGQLWEKYNASTGMTDTADEYKMPPMMGWTAGVFLACCEVANL